MEITEEQLKIKTACDYVIDKLFKVTMESMAVNTYEDGADKAIRLTLGYFLKHDLINLDDFVKLYEAEQQKKSKELIAIDKL